METLPYGEEIYAKTNNVNLKYLFEQPNLNARQARWLALISEYAFYLRHIKGRENKVEDSLSMQVHLHEIFFSKTYDNLKKN